jgi:hypothetical protein
MCVQQRETLGERSERLISGEKKNPLLGSHVFPEVFLTRTKYECDVRVVTNTSLRHRQ